MRGLASPTGGTAAKHAFPSSRPRNTNSASSEASAKVPQASEPASSISGISPFNVSKRAFQFIKPASSSGLALILSARSIRDPVNASISGSRYRSFYCRSSLHCSQILDHPFREALLDLISVRRHVLREHRRAKAALHIGKRRRSSRSAPSQRPYRLRVRQRRSPALQSRIPRYPRYLARC